MNITSVSTNTLDKTCTGHRKDKNLHDWFFSFNVQFFTIVTQKLNFVVAVFQQLFYVWIRK